MLLTVDITSFIETLYTYCEYEHRLLTYFCVEVAGYDLYRVF